LKAIILAGGIGTRLRPLSCTRPKLLFPLLNKPLLDWTLERLAQSGVDGATLAVKYMAEVFMQRYGSATNVIKITYSKEKTPMRTGGAIKNAEQLIGHNEPFLVLNGDIFTTINFKTLLKKHNESNAIATIALYRVEDPHRYGTAKLAENGRITQFVEKAPKEKAPSNLINAGIYVLDPKVFEYIPAGRPVSIEHEVFPRLAEEEKLYGHRFEDIWVDIGKIEDYLKANRILLDHQNQKQLVADNVAFGQNMKVDEPICVDANVEVGHGTTLGPYTVIGKDATVGNNSHIENSVILPGATIMDKASVFGAVVGEGAIIGKGATISEGCVIGDYAAIGDNVTVARNVTICHSKEVKENVPDSTHVI
jgi:NDP-sugar pyrophosphorylase family protein